MRRLIVGLGRFSCVLLMLAAVQLAHAERLALVISNSGYAVARLSSPRLDAEAMQTTLAKLDFAVTRATDANRAEMYRLVREFAERVKAATRQDPGTIALFYYSGHGMEVEGRNYLVPVDAEIRAEQDVAVQAVELNLVIRYLIGTGANPTVVVLDACRDNPYEKAWKSLGEGGLAAVNDVPPGMLVAFAAAPGHRAPQGIGRLSPYTEVLVQELASSTGTVVDTFRRVANTVYQRSLATKVPQVPHIDLVPGLSDEFRFAPAVARAETGKSAPDPGTTVSATAKGALDADTTVRATGKSAPDAVTTAPATGKTAPQAGKAAAPTLAAITHASSAQGSMTPAPRSFRDCPDCPEMVVIPEGSFVMGSPPDEEGRNPAEGPQHRVHVPSFALAARVITRAEYKTCVAASACTDIGEPYETKTGEHPAELDWKQIHQFIAWLSTKSARTYYLPSEAQWEYAARAGTRTARWWGEDVGVGHANCTDCGPPGDHSKVKIAVAGTFGPNPFGLYDMLGNFYQWVADCWHENYEGAPQDGSAWLGEGKCDRHVMRGGSGFVDARSVRSAFRMVGPYFLTGGRVARDLP